MRCVRVHHAPSRPLGARRIIRVVVVIIAVSVIAVAAAWQPAEVLLAVSTAMVGVVVQAATRALSQGEARRA